MRVCVLGRGNYEQLNSRTQQLASHGVDLHVLSLQSGQMDHATVHAIPQLPGLGGLAYLTLPLAARGLIRRLNPDVIDIHGASSYGAYCFSPTTRRGDGHSIPICTTIYGSDITAHAATSRIGRTIAKKCLQKSNLIYASSPVAQDDIHRVLKLDLDDRFLSRSWGIEMASIKTLGLHERLDERTQLGVPHDATVVVHNRQFRDFWRVDSLLDVAIKFCESSNHYFLFVCPPGDPIADKKVAAAKEKVAQAGRSKQIRFLQSVGHDRMLKIFNAADIFTCFGNADLLSSSVLEAMALGLIPVLRNLPAYTEVIHNGRNGYLHDELVESDVLDLFCNISDSLSLHRENFADPNRKLIAGKYDARECSRWMVDRYRDLAEGNPFPISN